MDDLPDELAELIDQLPVVRMLPRGHPERAAWMSRKHDLLERIGWMGTELPGPRLAPVRPA